MAETALDALGVAEGFDVVEHGGAKLGAGVPAAALVDPSSSCLRVA
jgi:hypothetical protein